MRTPTRLLSAAASLVVAAAVLAPSPAPADSDARLLVVNNPTAKVKLAATGVQLTAGAEVTNTTKTNQPASNFRIYLRSIPEQQQPGRRPAGGVRRYQVVDKPVKALKPGASVAVKATVILPDKVPAGRYQVRACIERLLYRNCEFTPNEIVVAPAIIVLTPDVHDFGTVAPEFPALPPRSARRETSTHTFTVTNQGGVVSGVPSLTLTGESTFAYELGANTCESPLHRNETCTVQVTFGYAESGTFTANLDAVADPGGFDSSSLTGTVQSNSD